MLPAWRLARAVARIERQRNPGWIYPDIAFALAGLQTNSHSNSTEGGDVSIQRIETNARMSKVVVHGDTVYLAGLIADKALGQSVAEQTREILGLIDSYLAKAGTDKSKMLTATIWLSDIRTVDELNKAWDAWVTPGHTPARACIEALLQGPEKQVEIQVTAAR
jgi:enamine deaminase RidA (YjgF/YER057c/UK114 family)